MERPLLNLISEFFRMILRTISYLSEPGIKLYELALYPGFELR